MQTEIKKNLDKDVPKKMQTVIHLALKDWKKDQFWCRMRLLKTKQTVDDCNTAFEKADATDDAILDLIILISYRHLISREPFPV